MFMDEIGLIFALRQPSQVLVLRLYWLQKITEMQLVFYSLEDFVRLALFFSFYIW